jgi:hypothetical protein
MYDRVVVSAAHVNTRRARLGGFDFPLGITAVKTFGGIILTH